MKVFYTTFSIALAILIANPTTNVQAVAQTTEIAQTRNRRIRKTKKLFKIILKNGSSMWATITGFNSQKKTVQITPKNGNSRAVSITEIKRIIADKKSPVVNYDRKGNFIYRSGGIQVLRDFRDSRYMCTLIQDEDAAEAKQSTWSDISLNQFQLKDGETNVDLSNVASSTGVHGIHSETEKSLYVIDEIEFDDSESMTIKVSPILNSKC